MEASPGFITTPDITITTENISVRAKLDPEAYIGKYYYERTVLVKASAPITTILETENLVGEEALMLAKVLASDLGSDSLNARDRLHIFFEASRLSPTEVLTNVSRISVYRAGIHLVSIARSDDNRFVYAKKPEEIEKENVKTARKRVSPTVSRSRLPSAYDGIYRAALSEGLTPELAGILIKVFCI